MLLQHSREHDQSQYAREGVGVAEGEGPSVVGQRDGLAYQLLGGWLGLGE